MPRFYCPHRPYHKCWGCLLLFFAVCGKFFARIHLRSTTFEARAMGNRLFGIVIDCLSLLYDFIERLPRSLVFLAKAECFFRWPEESVPPRVLCTMLFYVRIYYCMFYVLYYNIKHRCFVKYCCGLLIYTFH